MFDTNNDAINPYAPTAATAATCERPKVVGSGLLVNFLFLLPLASVIAIGVAIFVSASTFFDWFCVGLLLLIAVEFARITLRLKLGSEIRPSDRS